VLHSVFQPIECIIHVLKNTEHAYPFASEETGKFAGFSVNYLKMA
jgi:hypothetical protein